MSNEYKEWLNDRAYEALDDIAKIAELWEQYERTNNGSFEYYWKIRDILKEGGWI